MDNNTSNFGIYPYRSEMENLSLEQINTSGRDNHPSSAPPEANSKMVSGGEELADHDFPAPDQRTFGAESGRPVAVRKPELEAQRGGAAGAMPGDKQKVGVVGAIMDQDLVEPDFSQQTR